MRNSAPSFPLCFRRSYSNLNLPGFVSSINVSIRSICMTILSGMQLFLGSADFFFFFISVLPFKIEKYYTKSMTFCNFLFFGEVAVACLHTFYFLRMRICFFIPSCTGHKAKSLGLSSIHFRMRNLILYKLPLVSVRSAY